jgi:hypothetical protein
MLAAHFDPESKFAPPKEIDGAVFLDRNPKIFEYVLDYLRNGCRVVFDIPDNLVKSVCAEAEYFGLIGLKRATKKPAAEPLSDEQLKGRVKIIRDDFMQDPSNIFKLTKSMDELSGTPDFARKFVQLNADCILYCKDDERKGVISMIAILVERNELTSCDVKAGLVGLIRFLVVVCENSQESFDYLGEMMSTMLYVKAIDIPWLCNQVKEAAASHLFCENIIRALAKAIEANRGKDEVRAAFSGSSAEWLLGADWASVSKDIL